MAKINNSEVMQKLVDELKLYPGKDVIPSELAEKILPVFLINNQEVTVSTSPTTIVRSDLQAGSGWTTLYTTSSTKDTYMTFANVSVAGDAAALAGAAAIEITIDGTAYNIVYIRTDTDAAFPQQGNLSTSFNNPIKLDQGSVVRLYNSNADTTSVGSVGFYEE